MSAGGCPDTTKTLAIKNEKKKSNDFHYVFIAKFNF